jgi:hypothetical protein
MAELVYFCCALTSLACAVMLYRGYRRAGTRFLIWCCLCFTFLAVNNALLFMDRVLYPDDTLRFMGFELSIWRGVAALTGLMLLLFGLIWDAE